jgi:hypothetical protein
MKSIKQILMERDGLSNAEAQEEINTAKEQLLEYLDNGELDLAENICQEFFNLEPDYIWELMS